VLPINFRLVRSTGVTPGTWIAVRTRPGNVIDRALRTVATFNKNSANCFCVTVTAAFTKVHPQRHQTTAARRAVWGDDGEPSSDRTLFDRRSVAR
jgi:hypothetical protein